MDWTVDHQDVYDALGPREVILEHLRRPSPHSPLAYVYMSLLFEAKSNKLIAAPRPVDLSCFQGWQSTDCPGTGQVPNDSTRTPQRAYRMC